MLPPGPDAELLLRLLALTSYMEIPSAKAETLMVSRHRLSSNFFIRTYKNTPLLNLELNRSQSLTTQTGIFLRVSVLTQKDSRTSSGAALAASAKLKSLFVSQKIKEIAALDRHETHAVDNLLSIHFQHHQRRETRLFSLGNPGKNPRYLFFFFPQANKHSPSTLCREMTCLLACWAPSVKGLMIHRWV